MKHLHFFVLSIMSLLIAACSSGGAGSARLLVDHDPCKEDNKSLSGLTADQRQSFYNLLTPIANLDRAFDLAPKKDNQKAKIPEAQGKMVKDIRELCLIQTADLGSDYNYQTFKGQKSITSGKAENIFCPVQLEQKIVPDKTLPAFVDPVTKEVKSHLELAWKKDARSEYKDLGPINAVDMKGEAKTQWLKNPSSEINVSEKFDLSVGVTGKESLAGEYKVCRKYYSIRNAKYELAVTRIDLTIDKVPMQGKYLTFTKYIQNPTTLEWEFAGRDPRNDFYLNNELIKPAEMVGLEKKRKEAAGL